MLMSTVPDLFEKLSVLLTTLTLVTRVRVESASPLSRLSGQICSSLRRWAQIDAPPQSLQMLLRRLCGHFVLGCDVLALFSLPCVSGSSRPLPSYLNLYTTTWSRCSGHRLGTR